MDEEEGDTYLDNHKDRVENPREIVDEYFAQHTRIVVLEQADEELDDVHIDILEASSITVKN